MREFLSERDEKRILKLASSDERKGNEGSFDFDKIPTESKLFGLVSGALARLIESRRPDAQGIVSIAAAATRLGDSVAQELDMTHVAMQYDRKSGFYLPGGMGGIEKAVVIDDKYVTGETAEYVVTMLAEEGVRTEHVAVIRDESGLSAPSVRHRGNVAPVNALSRLYKKPV